MTGAAEVLRAAADLIEPEGAWTQGTIYRDAEGRDSYRMEGPAVCWCALGAILQSGGNNDVALLLDDQCPKTREGQLRPISAWNDAPGRTQAEVVAKLREAADLYEATHSAASLGEGRDG